MKIKLLVVDDEKEICDFVKSFFKDKDLKVLSALSGVTALKIFEKERPQIIILDILMKGIDGIEVLRRIKQIDQNNDVFMVTKVVDEPDKVKEAERLGAAGYITKPISLGHLERVVMQSVKKFKQK